MPDRRLIRRTKSVCPVCLKGVDASIVERDGKVYMDKACPAHGDSSLLISSDAAYYRSLSDYYFPLMAKSLTQKDYIAHLTNRCDLDCPICLARANQRDVPDYPLADLKEFLKGKTGYKIDLMGAEPAMREDLPQIIEAVKRSGNISALHTNGVKIADRRYLAELKKAGLDEVHLQFDGFDDAAYKLIRGKALGETKKKALGNLEELGIATDLVVTIVRGVNEKEAKTAFDYAVGHTFVKEVFLLGCRFLGGAKELPLENCMMPDELIDVLESATDGRISRGNVLKFQKLYFALLAAFSVRKCFYINHYLISRKNDTYLTLDEIYNLDSIERNLERFKEMKLSGNRLAVPYLVASLARALFDRRTFRHMGSLLSMALPFLRGFNLSRLSGSNILIGYISACDAYSFDYEIAKNCGKGAISCELGIQDTGAIDNILRDKIYSKQ